MIQRGQRARQSVADDTAGTTVAHAPVHRFLSAGPEMRFNLCVGNPKMEVPLGSQTPHPRSLRQPARVVMLFARNASYAEWRERLS
jgi:hypothetical protein